VVGLFDEARIHLTGLKRMVELRGGIADDSIRCSSMLAAILMYVLRFRIFRVLIGQGRREMRVRAHAETGISLDVGFAASAIERAATDPASGVVDVEQTGISAFCERLSQFSAAEDSIRASRHHTLQPNEQGEPIYAVP
jgi:hypothetical protein